MGSVSEVEQSAADSVLKQASSKWSAFIDFSGGVTGGAASVYVGQPLDTVKVKMQTFPALYRNATHCFVDTYRQEGITRGLYAGTVPSLAAQVSENALLFLAYGRCQHFVSWAAGVSRPEDLSVLQNAVAGSLASFFSTLALCPTELVKCKQQAMQQMRASGQLDPRLAAHKHIGPVILTKLIVKEEGLRGLYRGLVPTLYREMPGYFFYFGAYEVCRKMVTRVGESKEDLGALKLIFCGGMAGTTLWLAVFPTDVIKSRVQVQSRGTSMFPLILKIAREEGFLAFYKGLGPTLLRTFPATGALFVAYENTRRLLRRGFDSERDTLDSNSH